MATVGPSLSIVTWNVSPLDEFSKRLQQENESKLSFGPPDPSKLRNLYLNNAIRHINADILCLQSAGKEFIEGFSAWLGDQYDFYAREGQTDTLVVWRKSRFMAYPLVDDLSELKGPFTNVILIDRKVRCILQIISANFSEDNPKEGRGVKTVQQIASSMIHSYVYTPNLFMGIDLGVDVEKCTPTRIALAELGVFLMNGETFPTKLNYPDETESKKAEQVTRDCMLSGPNVFSCDVEGPLACLPFGELSQNPSSHIPVKYGLSLGRNVPLFTPKILALAAAADNKPER